MEITKKHIIFDRPRWEVKRLFLPFDMSAFLPDPPFNDRWNTTQDIKINHYRKIVDLRIKLIKSATLTIKTIELIKMEDIRKQLCD